MGKSRCATLDARVRAHALEPADATAGPFEGCLMQPSQTMPTLSVCAGPIPIETMRLVTHMSKSIRTMRRQHQVFTDVIKVARYTLVPHLRAMTCQSTVTAIHAPSSKPYDDSRATEANRCDNQHTRLRSTTSGISGTERLQ